MNIETVIIAVAGVFAVASSVGVLLTRDNFYAALYMSVTMLFVAAMYAAFDLQPVVVIIALIFVGAVGIVTVAVAATTRGKIAREVSLLWVAPVFVVFAILAYAYYSLAANNIEISGQETFSTIPTDYFSVVILLFSLTVLMMLSAIKLARRAELR